MTYSAFEPDGNVSEPTTWLKYLKGNAWVGIGGAVEWITWRDMEVPPSEYNFRFDRAVAALIAEIQRLDPASCAATVEGTPTSDPNANATEEKRSAWQPQPRAQKAF